MLIAAAEGKVEIPDDVPQARGGDNEVKLSVGLVGGKGDFRQGILREIVARFELSDGLHIYGEPVPDGLVATRVTVKGPDGLMCEAPILPPTEPLTLAAMGVELQVWSGEVDIRVPIYAASELATEVAPLAQDSVEIEVTVRYQACNDDTCLLPRTETFTLDVPMDVTEVPAIPVHQGHGQREGNYDGLPHMKRLLKRKPSGRNNPI
ncbi:MAG: protein-disulfide reductase DsbD domain-containing protein [Pseudomonadota bacterium]|nr:protein-disulfide reductase DsbD domain-containing protein [Pseudomonadota bacterium]MEC8198926.1 protein-disulfide reductase DsbD domain-containing protein [Pseudomonadota bacterium]MEC8698228.1 protein-disulfide reductase DsbD domain-containing protein [Pseudomonadota bacterium]